MVDWVHSGRNAIVAKLAMGLELAVTWEGVEKLNEKEPHWNVFVFGRRLKNRSVNALEAKERAELVARKWLQEAFLALGVVV